MSATPRSSKEIVAATIAVGLSAAADLIDAALKQLDRAAIACECCEAAQFENYEQARVYEQLAETPEKLRRAAQRVAVSVKIDGRASRSSKGFTKSNERLAATRRSGE